MICPLWRWHLCALLQPKGFMVGKIADSVCGRGLHPEVDA